MTASLITVRAGDAVCKRRCEFDLRAGISLLILLFAVACGRGSTATPNTYSTTFPATENPISEGGKWVNGGTTGLDWTNILTLANVKAYGSSTGSGQGYDDSTAVLQNIGFTWGPNQTATGVVYLNSSGNAHDPEVELLLNFTIAAHNATGYVCDYSVKNDGTQYFGIGRWNGPFGNFTPITTTVTGITPLANGERITCNRVGSTLYMYRGNGTLITSVVDTTYTGGSPGIGTDLDTNGSSINGTFGFSSFLASGE